MFKNKYGQVRSGWLILCGFFIMFIFQGIFMIPGSFYIMEADAMETGLLNPTYMLIAQGGGTVGGIIGTIFMWRVIQKHHWRKLGFEHASVKDLLFGLLLGAASITFMFFILLMTGNVTMVHSFTNPQISLFLIHYLILFILVGIFEELFFRGYVMQTMASRKNKVWVIYMASALLFSFVHGLNPNVSSLGLVNIFFVGLLFAYMFVATKSLLMPIGYHITWNYFQGSVFGFAVSGNTTHALYEVDITGGNDWLTGGSFGLEGGFLTTLFIGVSFIATYFYVRFQNDTIKGTNVKMKEEGK